MTNKKFYFEANICKYNFSKETNEKEEKFYIEGFAATTDVDTEDWKIEKQALEQASVILKETYNTVLFNHNRNYPIGKIVDVKVIKKENGEYGLWVKVFISKTEQEIIEKIKEGVLSKFSIGASGVVKEEYDEENEKIIYVVKEMYPFEISLVSVPANPEAKAITYYIAKSLKEDKKMSKEKEKKPMIKINKTDVDYKPWSQVDKIKLGQILFESGNTSAIKEAFGVVPDVEKRSTWKFPHHILKNVGKNEYELILSYTGLMAAYKSFRGARNKPKLTSEQASSLKSHLRKHFRFLVEKKIYEEVPEALKELGNIDMINLIIKELEDEELTEKELEKLNKFLENEALKDETTEKEESNNNDVKKETQSGNQSEKIEEHQDIEKNVNSEEMVLELDMNKFAELIASIVCQNIDKVLDEKFKNLQKDKEGKDMEKEKKDIKKNEENKVKKEVNKEQNIEKEKKENEGITVELKLENLEKMLKEYSKVVEQLHKELKEIKEQPIYKGMDNQREEDNDEENLESFIKSDKFEKMSVSEKLEVLKKLLK